MYQVSCIVDSIILLWFQLDQFNGVILDYELQYYEKEFSEYNVIVIKSFINMVIVQGFKVGVIYVFQVWVCIVVGYGCYSGKMYFQIMIEVEYQISIQEKLLFIIGFLVVGLVFFIVVVVIVIVCNRWGFECVDLEYMDKL